MKKFLLLAALLLSLLAACDPPLTHGYVYDKHYYAAWVQYVPGSFTQSCSKVGKSTSCSSIYHPGYTIWHPAEYELLITTCSSLQTDGKCQTGWVYVDEYDYHRYQVGNYYGGDK